MHEALKAYEELNKEGIAVRIIDAYSIKPLDKATISKAAAETGILITVEDHWPEGGLGDAVLASFACDGDSACGKNNGLQNKGVAPRVVKLAVGLMPDREHRKNCLMPQVFQLNILSKPSNPCKYPD